MFVPPGRDTLANTFAKKHELSAAHGIVVLKEALTAVGCKRSPQAFDFNREHDTEAIEVRLRELKLLLEDKFQGTQTIFGVHLVPDMVAEGYARLLMAMGGEHSAVQHGSRNPFMRKAASSWLNERIRLWPGFATVVSSDGNEHDVDWYLDQTVITLTNVGRQLHPFRNWPHYNNGREAKKEKKEKIRAEEMRQKETARKVFSKRSPPDVDAPPVVAVNIAPEVEVEVEDGDPVQCPVCRSIMTVPMTLQCGHSFCMTCLPRHQAPHADSVGPPIAAGMMLCMMCRATCRRPVNVNQTLNRACVAARQVATRVPIMADVAPARRQGPAPPGKKAPPKQSSGKPKHDTSLMLLN